MKKKGRFTTAEIEEKKRFSTYDKRFEKHIFSQDAKNHRFMM